MTEPEFSQPRYVHAPSATALLSETRPLRPSSVALHALNLLLDELLWLSLESLSSPPLSAADHVKRSSGAEVAEPGRVRTPLTTEHLKSAGVLKVLGNGVGKNAVLEAELALAEYLRVGGSGVRRDPALVGRGVAHGAPPPSPSHADGSEQQVKVEEIFAELRGWVEALCPFGARSAAGTPYPAPGSGGVASALSAHVVPLLTLPEPPAHVVPTTSTYTSPALALYTTALISYLAEYVLKGLARVVERDPVRNVVKCSDVLVFAGEDEGGLWGVFEGMRVRAFVEREVLNASQHHYGGGGGGGVGGGGSSVVGGGAAATLGPRPIRRGTDKSDPSTTGGRKSGASGEEPYAAPPPYAGANGADMGRPGGSAVGSSGSSALASSVGAGAGAGAGTGPGGAPAGSPGHGPVSGTSGFAKFRRAASLSRREGHAHPHKASTDASGAAGGAAAAGGLRHGHSQSQHDLAGMKGAGVGGAVGRARSGTTGTSGMSSYGGDGTETLHSFGSTGDAFEELMMSGKTMKVSLTPGRLKTMEAHEKERLASPSVLSFITAPPSPNTGTADDGVLPIAAGADEPAIADAALAASAPAAEPGAAPAVAASRPRTLSRGSAQPARASAHAHSAPAAQSAASLVSVSSSASSSSASLPSATPQRSGGSGRAVPKFMAPREPRCASTMMMTMATTTAAPGSTTTTKWGSGSLEELDEDEAYDSEDERLGFTRGGKAKKESLAEFLSSAPPWLEPGDGASKPHKPLNTVFGTGAGTGTEAKMAAMLGYKKPPSIASSTTSGPKPAKSIPSGSVAGGASSVYSSYHGPASPGLRSVASSSFSASTMPTSPTSPVRPKPHLQARTEARRNDTAALAAFFATTAPPGAISGLGNGPSEVSLTTLGSRDDGAGAGSTRKKKGALRAMMSRFSKHEDDGEGGLRAPRKLAKHPDAAAAAGAGSASAASASGLRHQRSSPALGSSKLKAWGADAPAPPVPLTSRMNTASMASLASSDTTEDGVLNVRAPAPSAPAHRTSFAPQVAPPAAMPSYVSAIPRSAPSSAPSAAPLPPMPASTRSLEKRSSRVPVPKLIDEELEPGLRRVSGGGGPRPSSPHVRSKSLPSSASPALSAQSAAAAAAAAVPVPALPAMPVPVPMPKAPSPSPQLHILATSSSSLSSSSSSSSLPDGSRRHTGPNANGKAASPPRDHRSSRSVRGAARPAPELVPRGPTDRSGRPPTPPASPQWRRHRPAGPAQSSIGAQSEQVLREDAANGAGPAADGGAVGHGRDDALAAVPLATLVELRRLLATAATPQDCLSIFDAMLPQVDGDLEAPSDAADEAAATAWLFGELPLPFSLSFSQPQPQPQPHPADGGDEPALESDAEADLDGSSSLSRSEISTTQTSPSPYLTRSGRPQDGEGAPAGRFPGKPGSLSELAGVEA